MQQQEDSLSRFIDLPELGDLDAIRKTFPTRDSLRWFIRRNRALLIERGALIALGSGLRVDPVLFQRVAIEVGQRAIGAKGQS